MPLEMGYRLQKSTFYYLNQGCHWLEGDDLNEVDICQTTACVKQTENNEIIQK